MRRRRAAILISGRGSNMVALLQAAAGDPDYPVEFALVLSNKPEAGGLTLAREAGIPTVAVDQRQYRGDRVGHEHAIAAALDAAGIEIVCLAGYMRLLSPWFVERYAGRMLNIHPSLLPAFPGLDTHARALAAGVKLHGCTVHLVTATMDEGPILAQAAVPVLPDDTEDGLAERVLAQEHRIYPMALALFAAGNLTAAGTRGTAPDAGTALINPLPEPPGLP